MNFFVKKYLPLNFVVYCKASNGALMPVVNSPHRQDVLSHTKWELITNKTEELNRCKMANGEESATGFLIM